MTAHSHRFTLPCDDFARRPGDERLDADELATVPEWRMTNAQWIAHQERLYGQDWRSEIDRMDGEAADAAFHDWFGDVPFDAAPDLSAYNRSTAGMAQ